MKSVKRLFCLLITAMMLLSLFSGCGDTTNAGETTNPSETADSNTSEEWEPVSAVPEFEEWLNAKLTALGYPLQVTFLAPEEDGYVKGEMSYTGSEEDIYTAYLYFYVYLKEDLETIDYAVVSARENCPDEVLAAHKKLALELSLHFDPNIQEATVDAIFDVLPDSETEYYVDPETGISVFASDRNYQAFFDTAFCSHELRKEIETGHIWYFVYNNYVSPSTAPAILEVQDLINEAFLDLGQPLEIVFVEGLNANYSYLYYRGDGQPSYHPHEQMQIELSTSEDGAITWLDITIPHTAQEIYEDIQKELAIRLCAHFFSSVPQSDVELMFDINANWDQYQQEQRGNLYIYPHDYYLYYDISEDANFRLLSDPNRDGQSFILTIPPIGGSNTPADKPVLEYPLTSDAFLAALEYALPEWEIVPNSSDWYDKDTYYLNDSSGNIFHIAMDVRMHDRVIKSITVWDLMGVFIEDPTVLMTDIMSKINLILDPNSNEETFRNFYKENCLLATKDNPITFTGSNFEGKLSKSASDRPSVTYTFQLESPAIMEKNYFVESGLMQAPSTVDGRFSFLDPDPLVTYDFHTASLAAYLEAYLEDTGYPMWISCGYSSIKPQDIENNTFTRNHMQYEYAVYDTYGERLSMPFLGVNFITPSPEDTELYHIQYNRDFASLYSEESKLRFTSMAIDPIYINEPITRLLMGMSMLCDDGMTEKEAKALFSDTYEPIETSSGYLYVIYAPRDVVHILRENPETGEIIYSVLTKADYEITPVVTLNGEPVYTVTE